MVIAEPLALIRGAHFAATLLASGTVCFAALTIGSTRLQSYPVLRMRMNVLVWSGLALAFITGAMWLVWLASNILGESLADVGLHGGVLSVLAETRFGWIWCLRLALAVLLALLIFDPAWRIIQVVAAVAFLVLPSFVGHAGAKPGLSGDIQLVSDAAHLLAAGLWLGALPAFATLLWTAGQQRKQRWNDFAVEVTRRFSLLAAISVGALLVTGVVNGWNLLGGPRDLWATDYGRLVAFKVVLLAAMIAIATVNKFHLTPRLPAPAALRKLRRNSLAEIGIGLCVLVVVGYLGRLEPPVHVHPASTAIPPDAAFTHIHAPAAMADVTINPGRTGYSTATIHVSREDFSVFAAKELRLALDPPTTSGRPVEYVAKQQADGTWTINDIALEQPGVWTIRVIVIARSGETIVLDAPIVIDR